MAFVGKPRNEEQYGRLMGMIQPETTPSKRIGTEAPIGSVAAGPRAGQTAEEFTKAGQAPGAVFQKQLTGANIGGITRLAEQPLLREAGQEATRVAQEGIGYKTGQQKYLSEQPQFKFGEKETPDVIKRLGEGDEGATETAQRIFTRGNIPVPEFQAGDIKEFTPLQALRGGSVESLLRKEAAGPYSTGMAGLDALLFSKKGGAQALANKGIALRTAEQATADALEKQLTEEARKSAANLVSEQKSSLLGGLTKRTGDVRTDLQKRLETARAQRDIDYKAAAEQSQRTAQDLALRQLEQSFGTLLPGERDAIVAALASEAPNKAMAALFAPSGAGTLADVASDTESTQYGRLLSLMGMGGQDVKPLGLGGKTADLAARRALTAEELTEGERRNIEAMQAYREAALNAIMDYRRANPGLYGTPAPAPGTTRRDPSEDEFFGGRTSGAEPVFTEKDLKEYNRGSIA